MDFTIPVEFRDIVDEIVKFTCSPKHEVEKRVWMEALETGWNVNQDIGRFKATPHRYDERMAAAYHDGTGFIFETLVFWAEPRRQQWIQRALQRTLLAAERAGVEPGRFRILMLGDGTGNDSLYLSKHGLKVDYFDLPGSKTFEFALQRFKQYRMLGNSINAVTDYTSCLSREYDVVVCFEVLEHLPQPLAVVRDIGCMLKIGGIALVTESFNCTSQSYPTHLRSTARYAGRTPFLFFNQGMMLSWYNREQLFKPMEFTNLGFRSLRDFLSLLTDRSVLPPLLGSQLRALKRRLGRWHAI